MTEAEGAVNQLPSRGGGATQMPPLRIGPAAPRSRAADGEIE